MKSTIIPNWFAHNYFHINAFTPSLVMHCMKVRQSRQTTKYLILLIHISPYTFLNDIFLKVSKYRANITNENKKIHTTLSVQFNI